MDDKRQEDLDMLNVLEGIKRGILNLLNAIRRLIRFSLENIKTILVFVILMVGLGLGMYSMAKPAYKSALLISHIRLDNDYCAQMIDNLSSFIDHKNENVVLARELKISEETAKEVKSISYEPLKKNLLRKYNDSSFVLLPFQVEAEVFNKTILDTLEEAILFYLESNVHAMKQKAIDEKQMLAAAEKIKSEIKEIDSLKVIVNQGIISPTSATGFIFAEPINPISVYNKSLELYDKLQVLEEKRAFNDSFEVMVGFARSSKRSSHGKMFYAAIGVMLGYFTGLWFANYRHKRRAARLI